MTSNNICSSDILHKYSSDIVEQNARLDAAFRIINMLSPNLFAFFFKLILMFLNIVSCMKNNSKTFLIHDSLESVE